MEAKHVPKALFAVGAATGAGGALLGAKGAQQQVQAHQRVEAAEEQYQARRELSERRRAATDDRLAEYAQLQREAYTNAVLRMVDFLLRHEKQVRESERLLVDGLDVTTASMPAPATADLDTGVWLTGAIGAAAAGTGTAAAISQAVDKYGVASTGKEISSLYGAAKDKAFRAFLGGGSHKSGGGGIALGNRAHKAAVAGPTALAVGIATKIKGTKALTHAKEYETARAVECANLDLTDARLRTVNQRVDELSRMLTQLLAHAVTALDQLDSVPFDIERHAGQFQEAMMLVKSVLDIASTNLISPDGNLTDESEALAVKYRPMTTEDDDDRRAGATGGQDR